VYSGDAGSWIFQLVNGQRPVPIVVATATSKQSHDPLYLPTYLPQMWFPDGAHQKETLASGFEPFFPCHPCGVLQSPLLAVFPRRKFEKSYSLTTFCSHVLQFISVDGYAWQALS